jgi:hypothetical protein
LRRSTLILLCASGWLLVNAPAALAETLCVDQHKQRCFASVQAALAAADDGDTVSIGPGTFAGGITITNSVQLVGASAGATVIRGGGPVVTIGDGVARPTVSISRVTIRDGLNTSRPDATIGAGGGILIPPLAAGNATGAWVTIADSVIADNRVAPARLTSGAGPPCGHPCAFALGAGIDNSGTLTLLDTIVSGNVAGSTSADTSVATEAAGGGIFNHPQGSLTLRRARVTDNHAAVTAPNAQFANGGGIYTDGQVTIEHSVVSDNSSEVSTSVASSFPFDVQMEANAGGIRITEFPGASATITGSRISGNRVNGFNSGGDVQATNGGIDDDGSLVLISSSVDHNTVSAAAPPLSGFLAGAIDGGLQVTGIATIRDSVVGANRVEAASEAGIANAAGAGIGSLSGRLTLDRSVVTGNRASGTGIGGLVLGGGILNVAFGGGPPQLTISDSVITANKLAASPAITPQGGGLYTTDIFGGGPFPVSLTRTVIAGNQPDDCVGC